MFIVLSDINNNDVSNTLWTTCNIASNRQKISQWVIISTTWIKTFKLRCRMTSSTGIIYNSSSWNWKITYMQISNNNYGEINSITDWQFTNLTTYTDVVNSQFTLPAAGTYMIMYNVYVSNNDFNVGYEFVIADD